jgi:hypothetical protein
MNEPPVDDNTHLKDSCNYSVETAKQFLTFGAGGLAFVAGLALSPSNALNGAYYWAFALFTASIVLGLLYIMNVVGHINQTKNYDVYTARLRWISGLQTLAVIGGVTCLAVVVFQGIQSRTPPAPESGLLELTAGGRSVRYAVPSGSAVAVKVGQTGDVDLRVESPSPQRPPKAP